MRNPFTHSSPHVSPSMNQVQIVDLPGLNVPSSARGKNGYELLSAMALRELIWGKLDHLGLDPATPDLIRAFDGCFTAVSPPVRHAAQNIARAYGRRLAYHLLTLKRGDPINRAARPDWLEEHWAFWRDIQTVWVGGGLLAGQMGPIVVKEAARLVQASGFPQFQLRLSPFAASLPMVGAARTAPAGANAMLLFDFGQTSVKRACGLYGDGVLVGLRSFDCLPAECGGTILNSDDPARAQKTANFMVATLSDTWRQARQTGLPLGKTMAVVVACYLTDGHPTWDPDWGCYGRLQLLTNHLQTYFSRRVSGQVGCSLTVQLLHDGAAAGLAYAGWTQTAVITFGTAMGIGFPPEDVGLRPLGLAQQMEKIGRMAMAQKRYGD